MGLFLIWHLIAREITVERVKTLRKQGCGLILHRKRAEELGTVLCIMGSLNILDASGLSKKLIILLLACSFVSTVLNIGRNLIIYKMTNH